MLIERKRYLDKLIAKRGNGLIKVITGLRRCGKTVLLFDIYKNWLLGHGVDEDHIIELALDDTMNIMFRNPFELHRYVRSRIAGDGTYYVLLDEIQMVEDVVNPYLPDSDTRIGFVDVLLGLMRLQNVDVYVTGSNSKMLSSDVLTSFRGRSDEIRVYPLSYAEFRSVYEGDDRRAWATYYTYGGMPFVAGLSTHNEKSEYLKELFSKVYLTDALERNRVLNEKEVLDKLLDVVSSSVGSLTNPRKLAASFGSAGGHGVSENTVSRYLDFFIDAFMLDKVYRYDVKGKRYLDTPLKYYFADIGLRNARLNFRQNEENHIMENVLYNELRVRGYDVDVGTMEYSRRDPSGKTVRSRLEVDFVANMGSRRVYVQSALSVSDEEARRRETNPLSRTGDSFEKIVVVRDPIVPWRDENGILYVGIEDFLLDERYMGEF